MCQVPFKLPSQYGSLEESNMSKSAYQLFKRNCLGLQELLCHSATIHTGFYSPNLWKFFFLALDPRIWGIVWEWDPLFLTRGLHIHNIPMSMSDQPVLYLHSSYEFWCAFFFNCLAVVLLSSQIPGGSEWLLLCIIVVILIWFWKVPITTVYLFCHPATFLHINNKLFENEVKKIIQFKIAL